MRWDGVEEEAVVAADPSREEEERGEEEDDRENDDDEEELLAADMEVLVFELRVAVPIEGFGIANRHGGRFEKEAAVAGQNDGVWERGVNSGCHCNIAQINASIN